jgi:hypothetical protein
MYKALISYSGKISMAKGQVREITDKEVVKDLLKAGYIEEVKPTKTEEKKSTKKKEE